MKEWAEGTDTDGTGMYGTDMDWVILTRL
jgi:hypothetical protein